jgi:hypothetical protein
VADPIAVVARDVVIGPYRLSAAHSFAELAEVRAFRDQTFRQRSQIVLDDELALDRRSVVLGLRQDDALVACVRIVPLPDADAGIAQFDHPLLAECAAATEVGRLAVGAGRSPFVLPTLLGLGSQWMVDHTPHRDYVAFCNAKLVPAYEAVGATDLGIELDRPGSTRRYRFVTGRFDAAADRALRLVDAFGRRRDRHARLTA